MKAKQFLLLAIGVFLAFGVMGTLTVQAASTTVPHKFRGTFYQYEGHKKWDKLVIKSHSARLSGPGYTKAFKLTPKAKSKVHKLSFKIDGKAQRQIFFRLDSQLKDSSKSALPTNGLSLATRKIKGKKVKVVRGFQGGYWFDFVKGHKIAHRYAGMTNGKY
ncbi:hypothetical protein [Levilactobacillus suantsaiihabitans]|uniref:Uncharacterized protein n=1 Tax=Levilactobacillus suantsaiihabitans TaxID=2487722 RepID=A0A4Z0JD38_9LACO|nr:hypothetical protein [Levilactobacillus suantsaiihabitans]TGD20440.1 hypothetical protein EGT51_01425 [Levilactobacillus suantsaiihabitans]